MTAARLLYVTDPMCAWCWGFAPVLAGVEALLHESVEIRYVMGGLAPDSEEPMDAAMKSYIRDAWQAVSERAGVSFNFSYWDSAQPSRSTWPACRAVLAAGSRGREMFAAIQQAYYPDARDPSDRTTLVAIAVELGFEAKAFSAALDGPQTRALLAADFALRDSLGARGYPSVGFERNGERRMLTAGWTDTGQLHSALKSAGLLRDDAQ